MTFLDVVFAIVPLFAITILGIWFRKKSFMVPAADSTLQWLLIHVFTPCLYVDSFLGNKALENIGTVLFVPVLGFCTVLIGLLLGYVGARAIGLVDEEQKRVFSVCVAFYNYGYIPIPITLLFFNIEVLGMLLLFNVGLDFAFWTLGFLILTHKKTSFTELAKHLTTPPLVAAILALLSNAVFVHSPLPLATARLVHMVGQATIPVALLIVGATVFDHIPALRSLRPVKPIVGALVLRLVLIPLCFISMALFLPIPHDLRIVLLIQAGMPSAVLPVVLIQHYGGDLQLAVRVVVATSVVSLLTMPIWLSLIFGYPIL